MALPTRKKKIIWATRPWSSESDTWVTGVMLVFKLWAAELGLKIG